MNIRTLGLGLLALAACQAAPDREPLAAGEYFTSVRFEFDT